MSFCPSKDIHSVYLDNELPEVYKAEYEAHITSCPKCSKELQLLKNLHSTLQKDSLSITPDSHYVEESFNRLMTKMSYSKNTKKAAPVIRGRTFIYPLTAVAAVAVFALILPLGLTSKAQGESSAKTYTPLVSSISGTQSSSITQQKSIPAISKSSANNVSYNSGNTIPISAIINKTNFSSESQVQTDGEFSTSVKYASILRPDIFEEEDAISIRITIPGIKDNPIITEMTLPLDVVSGKF